MFLILQEMKLPSSKLKKFLFLGDHLRVFHHCFLRCFHILPPFFYYCFRVFLLLIYLFISPTLGFFITVFQVFLFHHWFLLLFFECFHFARFLYRDCFFVRYFVFVLLYRECYAMKELFFLQAFFTLHSFPHLPQYREC